MYIGVFTSNSSILKVLVHEITLFGIRVNKISDLDHIEQNVLDKKINCIFLDIDSKDMNWSEWLHAIKNHEKTAHLYIIILTGSSDQNYLNHIILEGINGVFDTNQPLTHYTEKIKPILKLLEAELGNQRKYARIKIHAEEKISVSLEVSQYKSYKGYLQDISVAACAVSLEEETRKEELNENKKIASFQIKLDKVYFCEGVILRRVGNKFVIQFTNRNPLFDKAIVNFIYDRINNSFAE